MITPKAIGSTQKEAYELLIISCDDRIWGVADTAFMPTKGFLAVPLWLDLNHVVLLSLQGKVERAGDLRYFFWVISLYREMQTVIIKFALQDKSWFLAHASW